MSTSRGNPRDNSIDRDKIKRKGLIRPQPKTKFEITNQIAEKFKKDSIKKPYIKLIVESILEVFTDLLAKEGRIEIRDFGVFTVKRSPERIGRNPKTKEPAFVPARNFIQFDDNNVRAVFTPRYTPIDHIQVLDRQRNQWSISIESQVDNPEHTIRSLNRQFNLNKTEEEAVTWAWSHESGSIMFQVVFRSQ